MKIPKLFNNPTKVVYILLAFTALFFAYSYFSAAEATEAEFGATYTSEFNGGAALVLSERFAGNIDVGISLLSDQSWEEVNVSNNAIFWAQFIAKKPDKFWNWLPDELGIGPSIWYKTESPISNCHPGFALSLKKRFGDHFSVGIRHWSNAGICSKNRGQDLLAVGWRF